MAKMLDFNALTQPTQELRLKDDAHTLLRLTAPTEGLYQRFLTAGTEIKAAAQSGDKETIAAIYQLNAEIMSCNTDGLQITTEELRDKYRLSLYDLVVFMGVYFDFLQEITNAKN